MPLQGDFKTMTLEELLQWLYVSESSGELLFRSANADMRWFIVGGKLYDVRAPGLDPWASQQFGSENWEKAKNWALRDVSTPAKILERVGLLTGQEALQWLADAGRRSLHSIFMWDDGWFLFEVNEKIFADVDEHVGVPIEHLLLDVAREFDERNKVKDRLGEQDIWIEAVPGADFEGLSDIATKVVKQGVHVAELPWLLPDDFWEVSKQLYNLVEDGKALIIPPEAAPKIDPVKRYQEAVVRERSFKYEEAAIAFEEAITAAWEDPFARDVVAKWIERYFKMVDKHLVTPQRVVRKAEGIAPRQGDPFAAYILRILDGSMPVSELTGNLPFHRFFGVRVIRQLAASGALILN